MSSNLEKLLLGYDYFGKIQVPFSEHDNHNPKFAVEAAAIQRENEEVERELRQLFGAPGRS